MRVEASLRKVETFSAAARMFERRCTTQMLATYLERCDEILLENSAEGLRMARFGCAVAARFEDPEQMGAALAVLGGAYRRVRSFSLAEGTFSRGLALAPLGGLARGDLFQRRSVLRVDSGQLGAALVDADEAVLHRQVLSRFGARECESLACALVIRGNVYNSSGNLKKALDDNMEALTVTTPALTPRTYALALSNVDMLQASGPAVLEEVAAFMRMIKLALSKLTPRHTFARLKLQWVLANQLRRLGSTRKAEKILVKIRPGLLQVQLREFLCASLDLLEICKLHDDSEALQLVLNEMAKAVASTPESVEASILVNAAKGFLEERDLDLLRVKFGYQPIGMA